MLTSSLVLYKTPRNQIDTLLQCVLPSCVGKLFIIDNSPDDRWRELELQSPKIRYIHNENLGYGGSHNLAMSLAIEMGAKYHVVLNPDIRFEPTVLEKLECFMNENNDAVYVLPKVVYPNGELQYLCKLLPTPSDLIFRRFIPSVGFLKKWKEKKDSRYCLKASGYNQVMNPPCLSGCFMFMRLSAISENNIFFDDRFFMYFEDFDLIRRLHKFGKTLFYPEVEIIHDHAKESYKNRKMLRAHIMSAIRYFNKWGWIFDRERRVWNKEIIDELKQINNTYYITTGGGYRCIVINATLCERRAA